MGTPILLLIVGLVGIAATGATYRLLSGRVTAARQALAAAQEEQQGSMARLAELEERCAALVRERDELSGTCDDLSDQRDSILGALGDEHRRREEAEAEAADLRDRLDRVPAPDEPEPPTEASPTAAPPGEPTPLDEPDPPGGSAASVEPAPREADGCWALLLADVERRWAAVVGAPSDRRGVHLGAIPDQLTEALTREIDRLREEVGVDIGLATTDTTVEPSDPVLFLLAATDLLDVLATGCQRVSVELDGRLTLSGTEWVGPTERLEAAHERVVAAGAAVDPLVIEADGARQLGDLTGDAGLRSELGDEDPLPGEPTVETFRVRVAMHPTD